MYGRAIAKKCNLIVSFKPYIFGGLKKITVPNTYKEYKKPITDIANYSINTALDKNIQSVMPKRENWLTQYKHF